MTTPGAHKEDTGKLDYSLVPACTLEGLAEVYHRGAQKYEPNNWMRVEFDKERYLAAAMRHIQAWRLGEEVDESGSTHLMHAAVGLLMIDWHNRNGEMNGRQEEGKAVDNERPIQGRHTGSADWHDPERGVERKRWGLPDASTTGDGVDGGDGWIKYDGKNVPTGTVYIRTDDGWESDNAWSLWAWNAPGSVITHYKLA